MSGTWGIAFGWTRVSYFWSKMRVSRFGTKRGWTWISCFGTETCSLSFNDYCIWTRASGFKAETRGWTRVSRLVQTTLFQFCLLSASSTSSSTISNPLGLRELLWTLCKLSLLSVKVNRKTCISVTWSRDPQTTMAVNSSLLSLERSLTARLISAVVLAWAITLVLRVS